MNPNCEIESVVFLTPAKIVYRTKASDGSWKTNTVVQSVDIANRKVYENDGVSPLSEHVFTFLDQACSIPDDFFAASDEVLAHAAEANLEHERIKHTSIRTES